jgi:hypothetical protein
MSCDPFSWRCRQCNQSTDHLGDAATPPPDFCDERCEIKWAARRARRAYWWSVITTFLADIPRRFYVYRPYIIPGGPTLTTLRPNTPPFRRGDKTVHTQKRACNGCGANLGDATKEELEAAVAGRELPDARGECINCSAEVSSIAAVAVGDDVLYHSAALGKWLAAVVDAIDKDGKLRIRLADEKLRLQLGDAVEVPHGFGPHEWCTLDDLVEHRKVAARDAAEVSTDA